MPTPILDALTKYNDKLTARFFMPSHAGKGIGFMAASCFDMTEIDGLDNLLNSNGIIAQAEFLMSKAYSCQKSLMLTQGSTCANHIALGVASTYGKKILAYGQMHKSVLYGCGLFGLQLILLDTITQAETYFKQDNQVAGIIVTTPDYFGNVVSLAYLRKLCDSYDKLLIADSAHGAHFAFSDLLPPNISEIADMTSVSMHKTMNVYGGGALLNINNIKLYDKAIYYRNILHSSSPSYLIMASMDKARDDFKNNGELYYAKIQHDINMFEQLLIDQATNIQVAKNNDFSRLVMTASGYDCYDMADKLLKMGIGIEMAFYDKAVAIVNPFNSDCLNILAKAVAKLELKKLCNSQPIWRCSDHVVKSGELMFKDIEECEGCICALDIGLYPPAVALVKRGDKIDKDLINILKDCKDKLFGLVNGKVAVLQ